MTWSSEPLSAQTPSKKMYNGWRTLEDAITSIWGISDEEYMCVYICVGAQPMECRLVSAGTWGQRAACSRLTGTGNIIHFHFRSLFTYPIVHSLLTISCAFCSSLLPSLQSLFLSLSHISLAQMSHQYPNLPPLRFLFSLHTHSFHPPQAWCSRFISYSQSQEEQLGLDNAKYCASASISLTEFHYVRKCMQYAME